MRTYCIVVIMALAACEVPNARKCSTSSDCPSDAFCNSGICQAVLTVRIEDPAGAGVFHTNGAVDFRIRVEGGYPEKVELLRDGAPFAALKTPYTFQWDTSGVGEGSCTVTARATIGVNTYSSTPITVVVDRTPPKVTGQSPVAGDLRVLPHSPIYVDFSEPVKLPGSGVESPVMVTGSDDVSLDKDLSLSHGDTRLDVVLPAEPAAPSRLTLALKPGITDLAGNALELPAAVTWTIPLACSNDSNCTSPEKCVDGLCQPISGDCRQIPCSISIARPSTTTYTNGPVAFELNLVGAVPDKVELLENGAPMDPLSPPYRYTWDTSTRAEATYQITARATQGATVYESEPRTVVVDRTPPKVIAQEPASGDRNVGLHAPIRVQFSEPVMLPSSGPESAVSLTGPGGSALSSRVSLSSDQRTLQVVPIFDPPVPSEMALALKADITDLAGNALALAGPWSWHLPLWQKLGPYVAQEAGVIQGFDWDIDAEGRPTVAWGNAGGISVARWTGSSWENLGTGIHGTGTANYYTPKLVLKQTGDPVLAWTENVDPRPGYLSYRVFVKHKTANGWDYLGQNPIGGDNALTEQPSLVVDGSGGIWLGVQEVIIGQVGYHAVVRRFDGSLYWSQQGSYLNRTQHEANGPHLAVDGTGALWAAWTESLGYGGIDNWTVFGVFTSIFQNGAWTPVGGALNNNGSAPAYGVRLVVVPGRFPIISWAERMGRFNFQGWFRRVYADQSGPQIPAAAAVFYAVPSISAASSGDLFATPLEGPCFVFRNIIGQATWTPIESEKFCDSDSGYNGSGASIRTTASGEILLLWSECDSSGQTNTLYVKRLNR